MGKSHYIIPIFVTHEGCPHECVFCNQNSITGKSKTVTPKEADEIIALYLKTIENKNAIIEISFFGGTFTSIDKQKQKDLLAIAKKYKDNGEVNKIHLSTRPDYINDEILTYLKNYTVDIIELGVQSLDEEVLKKSGRGHTAEDVAVASKLIKSYGFVLGHQMMLGLPGDTHEKSIRTAKQIVSMGAQIARIYPTLVIRDTPLEKMLYNNIYKPYTLEETITVSKKIYKIFADNGIKIIRIGLQPTDEISEGYDLIDGPFHPAIRELVEGSLINDMIYDEICDFKEDKIEILLNEKDISKLYADKKKYFIMLKNRTQGKKFIIKTISTIKRGEILLLFGENSKRISLNSINSSDN
ncbi:elongator complex protein 3 [Clostridium sp. DL1XJH146]